MIKETCYKCHGVGFLDPDYDQLEEVDVLDITCPLCQGVGYLNKLEAE
jgi:DnaJ-class molecular chaperone